MYKGGSIDERAAEVFFSRFLCDDRPSKAPLLPCATPTPKLLRFRRQWASTTKRCRTETIAELLAPSSSSSERSVPQKASKWGNADARYPFSAFFLNIYTNCSIYMCICIYAFYFLHVFPSNSGIFFSSLLRLGYPFFFLWISFFC